MAAGTLQVQNNSAAYRYLAAERSDGRENGTLNIAVSTVLPNNTSITGKNITLSSAGTDPTHPTINVLYSSFIPATGRFVLLQAPTGHLRSTITAQVINGINANTPFLFTGSAAYLTNQTGFDQLVLNLAPKIIFPARPHRLCRASVPLCQRGAWKTTTRSALP